MEENVVVGELNLLANIKRKVCNVLDVFLSFLKKFDERKYPNIKDIKCLLDWWAT
jgi:hypothetical protein